VNITFTQESSTLSAAGAPFNIGFVDANGNPVGGGNNTIGFQIAGGQTEVLISTAAGAYAGGFGTVTSNVPISGTAVFSLYNTSGQLLGEAGVPSAAAVPAQSIFVDTNAGYAVGVAFANPNATAANIKLSLLDTQGQVQITTTQFNGQALTLGAGNHSAAFTSQFFPSFATPLAGTMQITTDASTPLAAIALRFNGAVFTTLPPVTIAGLFRPAVEWLGESHWLSAFSSLARLVAPLNLHLV
jgi:hypothetical protein